jgi:hypothetical protein
MSAERGKSRYDLPDQIKMPKSGWCVTYRDLLTEQGRREFWSTEADARTRCDELGTAAFAADVAIEPFGDAAFLRESDRRTADYDGPALPRTF